MRSRLYGKQCLRVGKPCAVCVGADQSGRALVSMDMANELVDVVPIDEVSPEELPVSHQQDGLRSLGQKSEWPGEHGFQEKGLEFISHYQSEKYAARCREQEIGKGGYLFIKRLFDILFSAIVIAVLFIPSLVLCIAIRIESPGNPFYTQLRLGKMRPDGTLRVFKMYKFRSMYEDADKQFEKLKEQNEVSGAMFKMKDDPRVTRIGHFIRKHSIDEFPQFLNVFLGQMSIVGPRPPMPRELPEYRESDFGRLTVKPGLTGPWQVRGRSTLSFDDMVKLDCEYIRKRSILYDLKLIGMTIKVVFTGDGAE